MDSLEQYLKANSIAFEKQHENVYLIADRLCYNLPYRETLIDGSGQLVVTQKEFHVFDNYECTHFTACFGGSHYIIDFEQDEIELQELVYLGKSTDKETSDFPYLGMRGKFELCNGSKNYNDWVKKALFLEQSHLGICEKNTLAGTLPFQNECKKNNLPFVIGETIDVRVDSEIIEIKLYVQSQTGWQSLLRINSQVNVFSEDKIVPFEYLFEYSDGLICVIGGATKLSVSLINKFKKLFDSVYFQVDTVRWASNETDKNYLLNFKEYIDKFKSFIKPILICDSFYLEQKDHVVKNALNKIGKVGWQHQSEYQHYKTPKSILEDVKGLFYDNEQGLYFHRDCVSAAKQVGESCNFEIPTHERLLPSYEMTQEESEKYESNEEMMLTFCTEFLEKNDLVTDEYIDRLEEEFDVISSGGFVDYFLILYDIVQFCNKENILTGVGRGSSGGSLIAMCLGIIKIDPIKYGLLFERFLNKARIESGAMPDIDIDFQSFMRDDLKRYVEQRYGKNNVVSIGTYSTFKIKQAIRDLCRHLSADTPQTVNYITAMIEPEYSYTELFLIAAQKKQLRAFVQRNYKIISMLPLLLNQQKNSSVHAAGIIIAPKIKDGKKVEVFDLLPVKSMDGVIVTEWEGTYIEQAGFLKKDLLGLKQLQKFADIIELIKANGKDVIDVFSVPLDDDAVYTKFQQGLNQDVFQFGTTNLSSYCQQLHPENINDLIAAVSLYRPGPIEIGAHNDYVSRKNGTSKVIYDKGLEEITKETYGLLVYQEQIMKAVRAIAGFSMSEADGIRKAIGKKNWAKMQEYKQIFIERAFENGYQKIKAMELWDNIEVFAGYSFNKSHAACYAITGYICQYLKVHYPIEYWTVTLQHAGDKIFERVAEISEDKSLKLLPPDINHSERRFSCQSKANSIYWSIESIKCVGAAAVDKLLEERQKGRFFSYEELLNRVDKSVLNKKAMFNLILCGAFDEIGGIVYPSERERLIDEFAAFRKEEFDKSTLPEKNYEWTLLQKQLCGLGIINYKRLIVDKYIQENHQYVEPTSFFLERSIGKGKYVMGVVQEVKTRNSKKGTFAEITLDNNGALLPVVVWAECYEKFESDISECEDRITLISGNLVFDSWRDSNAIHCNKYSKIIVL